MCIFFQCLIPNSFWVSPYTLLSNKLYEYKFQFLLIFIREHLILFWDIFPNDPINRPFTHELFSM